MKHHYELKPRVWWAKPIAFDWDDETGEINGVIGEWDSTFENGSIAEKKELAQLVGLGHILPADLLPYYKPFCEINTLS